MRRALLGLLPLLGFAIWFGVGCGAGVDEPSDDDSDCQRLCAFGAKCESTNQAECVAACKGLGFSEGCIDAVIAAGCAEYVKDIDDSPAFLSQCFATCSVGTVPACNGDHIQSCVEPGARLDADCAWVCESNGTHYVGTCASSYQGMVSPTGADACWCE